MGKLKKVLVFTICILGLLGIKVEAADMKYSIEANIPENQINQNLTYFDLKMSSGQKQTISLTLRNHSDKISTFTIEPHTAATNRNGVIDYSKKLEKKDSSMKYSFEELIIGETKYTLQPNEEKKVVFTIQMPEESYDGIILGGFYIHKEENQAEKEEEKSVQIKNDYSYVIGAKLTETSKEVEPKLQLNEVKPNLENYRTVVTANLQNTESVIVSGLNVDAKVYKKGSKDVLHETKKEGMSMAPNSNFDFAINWGNEELKPGKYNLELTAKDKMDRTWKFEKEFEIKGEESKSLNKKAVELKDDNTKLYIIIGVCLLLITILLIVLFILMRKKKRNQLK
ncbi:cell wall protein [Bacillus cereus]|nr:cell wall protein [Bacillus cereus]